MSSQGPHQLYWDRDEMAARIMSCHKSLRPVWSRHPVSAESLTLNSVRTGLMYTLVAVMVDL